jgi:hypothetical protein
MLVAVRDVAVAGVTALAEALTRRPTFIDEHLLGAEVLLFHLAHDTITKRG